MALGASVTIHGHGVLVRFDERLVNIGQYIANTHPSFTGIQFGYRLNCLDPARRIRRNIDCLLVIFLDAGPPCRDMGRTETADQGSSADHLGHRSCNQRKVDRGSADRDKEDQHRDKKVDQRRRR